MLSKNHKLLQTYTICKSLIKKDHVMINNKIENLSLIFTEEANGLNISLKDIRFFLSPNLIRILLILRKYTDITKNNKKNTIHYHKMNNHVKSIIKINISLEKTSICYSENTPQNMKKLGFLESHQIDRGMIFLFNLTKMTVNLSILEDINNIDLALENISISLTNNK